MGRWEPDSRQRLERAALELYSERGFDDTTVAQIAERAGLTERTFFRHFEDKREMLFGGAGALQDLLVGAVTDAPPSASPIEAVAVALDAVGGMFADRREFAVARRSIIMGSVELQERELIKMATLASAVADALRQRGVEDPAAGLTAEVAIAVFRVAFERWVTGAGPADLTEHMRDGLAALRVVTSPGCTSRSAASVD
jgi:AcrR family transcriptional regulator